MDLAAREPCGVFLTACLLGKRFCSELCRLGKSLGLQSVEGGHGRDLIREPGVQSWPRSGVLLGAMDKDGGKADGHLEERFQGERIRVVDMVSVRMLPMSTAGRPNRNGLQ